MNTCLSHSPLPSVRLRSKRDAIAALPFLPERPCYQPAINCFGEVTGSASGLFDSATRMSPLGRQ